MKHNYMCAVALLKCLEPVLLGARVSLSQVITSLMTSSVQLGAEMLSKINVVRTYRVPFIFTGISKQDRGQWHSEIGK